MATVVSTTTLEPVMKVLYKGQRVANTVFQKFKLLGMLPKSEIFPGKYMPVMLQYTDGGGRANLFADALTDYGAPAFGEFEVTRVNQYQIKGIDGEGLEASAHDKGSFVRGLKNTLDAGWRNIARGIEIQLFRTASGAVAQISNVASAVYTLTSIEEISNFELGEVLVAADGTTNELGALRNSGENKVITAINRSTGKVTTTSAITGIAANDWIGVHGDRKDAALTTHAGMCTNSTGAALTGLQQWIPPSGTLADDGTSVYKTTLFNQDRSADTRMLGTYVDANAYPTYEEALVDGIGSATDEDGDPRVVIIHPAKFRKLTKELGSKTTYDKLVAQGSKGAMAHISYKGVVVDSPNGPVTVVADKHCPFKYGWCLDMSTWKLHTLGACPRFLMEDGNKILRSASADQYTCRMGMRGNLACDAPSFNSCIIMPTA